MKEKCDECETITTVATCKKCGYRMCAACVIARRAVCPRCSKEKVVFT